MRIKLFPKTYLGKWALILSIAFIILITLKIIESIPLPTFTIAALGLAGFIVDIIAVIKKERCILVFLPILEGIVIMLWIAAEIIYPH